MTAPMQPPTMFLTPGTWFFQRKTPSFEGVGPEMLSPGGYVNRAGRYRDGSVARSSTRHGADFCLPANQYPRRSWRELQQHVGRSDAIHCRERHGASRRFPGTYADRNVCASQTRFWLDSDSLSPTGDVPFREGLAVGEEGRGEGAE